MHTNLLFFAKENSNFYDCCTKLAPYCRVAVIASEEYFLLNGKNILEQLKRRQLKATNIILPIKTKFSTETLCGLINLSDDVRLIIAFERQMFNACFYLATIKKIPSLVWTDAKNLDLALCSNFRISTDRINDTFYFSDDRQVFLNDNNKDNSEIYASIVVKRLLLTDYKIQCLINRKTYCKEYNSCIKILNEFDFKNPKEENLKKIDSELSLQNYFSLGKLFESGMLFPLKVDFNKTNADCLYFAKTFYQRFYKYLKSDSHYLTDYNLRADVFAKLTNIDADDIRKNLKKQCEFIKKNRIFINLAQNILISELLTLQSFIEMVIEVYKKLGGRDIKMDKNIEILGLLSCDYTKSFNSATLFREYILN